MKIPLVFLLNLSTAFLSMLGNKDAPFYQIEALIGETVHLPCNSTPAYGDEVILILWYREDKGTPIYSVDIRSGVSKIAKLWSDETVFGNRAEFELNNNPSQLTIRNSQISDTGIYRCRIDFVKAQTYNSRMVLIVIALPKEIVIRDENGVKRSTVVGPYNEGEFILLKCEAIGGNPPPTLVWLFEDIQIAYEISTDILNKSVQSSIKFGPLKREHLNMRLTCQARSHSKAAIVETFVKIDMNFPPLNIRLLGARQALSAGRRYDLLCQSAGGRPPAVITWWQNEFRLEKTTETTSSDGNQTTSTLSVIFDKTDAGKYLICKAYNHVSQTKPLEDRWKLDILYIPEVEIRLGTSLKQNAIREGTDVYFDCLVNAHPPIHRVDWLHNENALPANISQGIIISNHSLVLQGVNKESGGNFSCIAHNSEGEGQSLPLMLDILYAPICSSNQRKIYGVAKQENVNIKCTVDANPPLVEFNWIFNNSVETIDVAANNIVKTGLTSTVEYTPMTELDYGTLLCTAVNAVGYQKTPCIFHIIAAGRPDPVHNCSFIDMSAFSMTISCTEGFNGGLHQLFVLEVRNMYTKELYMNITSLYPIFTLSTLLPGNLYIIFVYASNLKGCSDATILTIDVVKSKETQLSAGKVQNHRAEFVLTPFVSLSMGLIIAGCIAMLAIIITLRTTCTSSDQMISGFSHEHNVWDVSSRSSGSKDIDMMETDEINPDVIPELLDSEKQNSSKIAYLNIVNQSSLPKHSKHQIWSGYKSLVIDMNSAQTFSSKQQLLGKTTKSISVEHGSTSNFFLTVNSNVLLPTIPVLSKSYEFNTYDQAHWRYKNNNCRAKEKMGVSLAHTPLMPKRESTV
uniref:Neural cell adhesion molecule 2 n=1 Tax=Ceratitis capitata TaxID=7213 RepID=W8BB58_CERCA